MLEKGPPPPTRRGHPGPQREGWDPKIVPEGDQTENISSQLGRASRLPRTPSSRPCNASQYPTENKLEHSYGLLQSLEFWKNSLAHAVRALRRACPALAGDPSEPASSGSEVCAAGEPHPPPRHARSQVTYCSCAGAQPPCAQGTRGPPSPCSASGGGGWEGESGGRGGRGGEGSRRQERRVRAFGLKARDSDRDRG